MTFLKFILNLTAGILLISCNTKKEFQQEDTNEVTDIVTEEVPAPPSDEFKNKFHTIKEWLNGVCSETSPKVPIEIYELSLSWSEQVHYSLTLFGLNHYQIDKNNSETRVDFQPLYFFLPDGEYSQLSPGEVMEKLRPILKEFTQSETFKQSFLAKANKIRTSYNDETIWSQ